MTARVLCVDDEPKVLSALQRQLHEQFDLTTAGSGAEALELLSTKGPFAVVVSDMRMPGMDGVELLAAVKTRAPESVRIMLTGNADQQTAVNAVNRGEIFRFLTKPCNPEDFARALEAGVAQYQLVTAKRELLEKTLRGAIKVLAEVLSLTNPVAFSHASRVHRLIARLCERLQAPQPWQVEVAAMLSQIGCVTVPSETLERAYRGERLHAQEVQMLDAHPAIASELIRNIPRLEDVARIVAFQKKSFDGSGPPNEAVSGADIPLGARILRVASDFDTLKAAGFTVPNALLELRKRSGAYDPAVLAALEAVIEAEQPFEIRELSIRDVAPHAVLADDVRTPDGCLLIAKGQEITPSVRQLLRNYASRKGLHDQLRVRVFVEKQPEKPRGGA